MGKASNLSLSTAERRRALGLAHVNAVLWSVGNGLTTGPLIIYMALDLGARNADIGWILAVPAFVGVLRIFASPLFDYLGGLRRGAVVFLTAAYGVIAILPWAATTGLLSGRVAWFVGLLCIHQLLESVGMVAVWAWLGHLVPGRMRGRYFARRQRYQIAALVPTLLAGALFADRWRHAYVGQGLTTIVGYAIPIGIGCLLLMLSVVPLMWMPNVLEVPSASTQRKMPAVSALLDTSFLRLIVAGCWISFFNGMTQTAQNVYPKQLGLDVWALAMMRMAMQIGQIALSPLVGRGSDIYGNRPVLAICQAIVAIGPLFYLAASPEYPYWIVGAWIAWSAFVGLNVGLPALMIKLAPRGQSAGYIAMYFALSGIAYAFGTLEGSRLLESFRFTFYRVWGIDLNNYQYMFYVGWVTRSLGVLLLLAIPEPGAWRLRDVFGLSKPASNEPERTSPWD